MRMYVVVIHTSPCIWFCVALKQMPRPVYHHIWYFFLFFLAKYMVFISTPIFCSCLYISIKNTYVRWQHKISIIRTYWNLETLIKERNKHWGPWSIALLMWGRRSQAIYIKVFIKAKTDKLGCHVTKKRKARQHKITYFMNIKMTKKTKTLEKPGHRHFLLP